MNKKSLIIWIIAIIIMVILVGAFMVYGNKSANTAVNGKPTVKIGATLALTGNLAFLGVPAKNAMLMALADLKKTGNLKYNYNIIFEDDKFDPTTAVTNVNKLISVDNVNAITSFGSPAGDAVSPVTEQNKIVHLNNIASDPHVAIGDYNFVHWTPPAQEASLLLSELKRRGLTNVVLLEANHPGVLAVTNALRQQLPSSGINILDIERFEPGQNDYRTVIQKAESKAPNADIWITEALSPDLEIVVKEIKEAGIKKPLTSVEAFEFSDQPQLFEGNWFVDSADTQQWFIDEYTQKYPSGPKTGTGNAYDAVKILVSAFEATGDGKTVPTEAAVQKYMASLKGYNGAMGNNLSMNPDGIVITQATVKMIKGGKVVNAQ